ncbi:MAG: hypothetical protein R3A80_09390 [Bdellovibrionota bacterium]
MSKWTLFSLLFLLSVLNPLSASETNQVSDVCVQGVKKTEAKIKKNLETLWADIDSTVGVEFFLVVLKGNDRMPASLGSVNMSSSQFYLELLNGMKKTSLELSSHGLKLNTKSIKKIETLISELNQKENCLEIVAKN